MTYEQARSNRIEQQIRPWDVLDAEVLQLLSVAKREDFVPVAHKALAFADLEIPLLGTGEEALRQGHCMLLPRVEARVQRRGELVARQDKVVLVGAADRQRAAADRAQ